MGRCVWVFFWFEIITRDVDENDKASRNLRDADKHGKIKASGITAIPE